MSICAGWDDGHWGVCGNLLGCGPEPRAATNNVPKQMADDPSMHIVHRGFFLVHLSDFKRRNHWKFKSEFIVFVCTLNVNIPMKHDFKVTEKILLSNVLLLFPVQSENTHTLPQSSFWKAALRLNKPKGQSALHGHSKERFMVNRPRFRLDSNSCWEICKLTAATFKMPLFLFIFN